MNILGTQYTLSNKAFEIYVSGCNGNPHCTGCHNPESWNFNAGNSVDENFYKRVDNKILDFNNLIDNIMIFGGEPLDNNHEEVKNLLIELSKYKKPIWLFTRYPLDEVPDFVKKYCEYIKCGRYLPEYTCDDNIQYGIKLATSNQNIYKKGKDY